MAEVLVLEDEHECQYAQKQSDSLPQKSVASGSEPFGVQAVSLHRIRGKLTRHDCGFYDTVNRKCMVVRSRGYSPASRLSSRSVFFGQGKQKSFTRQPAAGKIGVWTTGYFEGSRQFMENWMLAEIVWLAASLGNFQPLTACRTASRSKG